MKEAFDLIKERLEAVRKNAEVIFIELSDGEHLLHCCYDQSDIEETVCECFADAIEIVSEVEAEYGKDINVRSNGWISCNEKDHPYDGQRVLACINTRIATHEIIITDYNGEIYWFDGTISAWMPLPSPYKPTNN